MIERATIERKSLSTQVYEQIREMILNGFLRPGQIISQEELAREMEVSRTPVIHALQKLESDGLVVRNAHKNRWFLRKLTIDDMIVLYEIRESLETLACKYVVPVITDNQLKEFRQRFQEAMNSPDRDREYRKADNFFHLTLAQICPNQDLREILTQKGFLVKCLYEGLLRPPEETMPEHLEIIDALEKRDIARVEENMKLHISKTIEYLRERRNKGEV